jgi:hypothetical protein
MSVKHHSLKHYKDEHYKAIDEAKSYDDLKDIAIDVLKDMPQPIGEVCGPASTGGLGSLQKNLEVIEKTTHKLADQGNSIFNWTPFEKRFQHLKNITGTHTKEKNQLLLDGFYSHVFKSGYIKKFYFIHGWESSHGATWEHQMAKELGIEIVYLPKNFLDE